MPVEDAFNLYRHPPGHRLVLSELDAGEKRLAENLGKEESYEPFDFLRDELQQLQKLLYAQDKHRVLVVMQAMDTGGKDGCIKHVFSRVDPQGLNVISFKKPSPDELAHDFLWRVHEHVPRNGHMTVFNRSHYEDIIAVRVKDIYPESVWRKRYQHVLDFERMLAEEGTMIVKFFLNISKDEQKNRLQARLDNPAKHWKFNPDDLKDRARWADFMQAYEDVIERTSTPWAPWYVIPADRKWYRNLCVARIMVETLKGLNMNFPVPTWKMEDVQLVD
ncbi:MAG: PPK2 family polyphosphate kinase [Verrucomicrobiota bacterium]